MPFQIRHDGKVYRVHTEVGNGLTRVVFDEDTEAAQRARQDNPASTAAVDIAQGAHHE